MFRTCYDWNMISEETLTQDKTAGDLYDFLQAAAWKNVISESLSAHLRAAIKKIFSATAKPNKFWRDIVLTPSIDDRIVTLRANNSGECSEKTIEAYERRYYRSLRLYLDYLKANQIASTPSLAASAFSPPPSPSLQAPPAPPSPTNANLQNLAVQKVLAASLKFQQEVLAALSLLTQSEE